MLAGLEVRPGLEVRLGLRAFQTQAGWSPPPPSGPLRPPASEESSVVLA